MNSPLNLPAIAEAAASTAATWLRQTVAPRNPDDWQVKGHHDFVTEVDRTAEAMITEALLTAVPDSTVMGEELGANAATDGLVWVVDPLDGTTNFLHGYPQYAVSIAAAIDGQLEAGVVVHVPLGTVYRGGRGRGATVDGAPLKVSEIRQPDHALIGTGFPFKHLDLLERYQRQLATVLHQTSGVRRAGSAALDLADVAAGRFDGFWELMLAPWDTAAGILLVREAGGVVTDLEGGDPGLRHAGVVAGNPWLHEWLLGVVSDHR
jgi:myo-inositol-1(or 4)-monophosphatase